MEAGRREAAPGSLELVQAFVNTIDFEDGRDELASPDLLHTWLSSRGLLDDDRPVDAADVRRALQTREALRTMLRANNGAPAGDDAIATLNRVAERARLLVHFHHNGRAYLEPEAAGVDGALGRMLAIVFAATADGTWARLKACRDDACQWAFYDHSKNRSGAWCTMSVCGNRYKTRAYRQRQRRSDRGVTRTS